MSVNIIMPKLGLTMDEGTIAEWRKKEGDPVEAGEIIFVVATDKLTFEVEAKESGVLAKILVEEGESADVSSVVGIIAAPGENVPSGEIPATPAPANTPEMPDKGKAAGVGRTKVAVIGAGPGGYVAAIRAAQLGADVTIIERWKFGGTCLNVGCIPTKVLLHTVDLFDAVKHGAAMGLMVENPRVQWPALMKRKEQVISRLVGGVKGLMSAYGIDVVEGTASFLSEKSIKVKTPGGEKVVEADNVIIATGSAPSMPPIAGIDTEGVLSSDGILSMEKVPASLCIIGGGVIGIEFASIFAGLGTKVTVVEMLPEILPNVDDEIVRIIKTSLARKGVEFHTASKVTGFTEDRDGISVSVEMPAGPADILAEKVLVAVGRHPVTDGLGAEKIGIEINRGRIVVDEYLETSRSGIYAIGDCSSPIMLAHVASMEGEVAAGNIMGNKEKMDYKTNPGCIYTSPEIAYVGLTEKEAREQGFDVKVGRCPMVANGKSFIMDDTDGMVKFVVDGKHNEILGVHIIGPRATDLIVEGALALRLEATTDEIISTIHAHPTVGEALGEAAMDVDGMGINIPPHRR